MGVKNQMATQLEPRHQTIPQSAIKDMGFHSGPAFGLLRAAAEFLSKADIIPKQYQNNLSNCAVALNMAQRMGADPLMVMQNLYVVYGRPAWSAQFLIATLNTKGEFSKLRYEWSDEKDKTKNSFGCRAYAIELSTGETLYGPWVTIGLARSEGWYDRKSKEGGVASKWPTLTELMCMYRAAAFFVRTYCPEIAMGLRTSDEEEEVHAATNVTGQVEVIEKKINMPPAYQGPISESEVPTQSVPENHQATESAPKAPRAAQEPKGKQASKGKAEQPAAASVPSENPSYAVGSDPDPFNDPGSTFD